MGQAVDSGVNAVGVYFAESASMAELVKIIHGIRTR